MLNSDQLSKISIKGYKSIKECTLELKSINVLIGSNGSGKSNFISSFVLLESILNKELQLYASRSGISSLFYNGIKITEEIFFNVNFGVNGYGFKLITTNDNRIIFKNEYFDFSHGISRQTKSSGLQESIWEQGCGNNTDKYIIPTLKKQKWKVYHFHDTSANARIKQEQNISNNYVLMNDARNIAPFLYRLREYFHKEYENIRSTIQIIAPYFDDFILDPQEGNKEQIVLKWRQKGCEDIFNASQLSDGTLRFICLSTLLLQPKDLQTATIIIDEPELGLHPYAITILAEMVKQASLHAQIILSTQSVELLNEFDVEDIIVVNRKNDGSEFKRLNIDELELWLDEYSLGDLWKKNLLGGRI